MHFSFPFSSILTTPFLLAFLASFSLMGLVGYFGMFSLLDLTSTMNSCIFILLTCLYCDRNYVHNSGSYELLLPRTKIFYKNRHFQSWVHNSKIFVSVLVKRYWSIYMVYSTVQVFSTQSIHPNYLGKVNYFNSRVIEIYTSAYISADMENLW